MVKNAEKRVQPRWEQHFIGLLVTLIGIGVAALIGWVLNLRNDVTALQKDVSFISQAIAPIAIEIQKQRGELAESRQFQAVATSEHVRYETRLDKLESLSHGHAKGTKQ